MLVCGLCVLTLPAPAFAEGVPATFAENAFPTHFAVADFSLGRQAAIPAHIFAPRQSHLLTVPSKLNFEAFGTNASVRLETPALAIVAPVYAVPRAALPAPSGSSHKGWLALGIAGLVVAGVGAGAYAAGHSGICGGSYPSAGCQRTRDVGLALMPVGAVMAVAGFVMHARH